MTIQISTAARNAAAKAITDLIDVSGPGFLRIYTGTKPANADTAPTGTLLADFTLSNPAFGAPSTGVVTLDNTPALTVAASASGTAGWFRFLASAAHAGSGLGIIDGTVTATGGGGDLTLDSASVTSGLNVTVSSGTITMPA